MSRLRKAGKGFDIDIGKDTSIAADTAEIRESAVALEGTVWPITGSAAAAASARAKGRSGVEDEQCNH
jgi:hypothetical protein